MRQVSRTFLVCVAVCLAIEPAAVACPFCGGWGSPGEGLFQTLAVVAVFGLVARAIRRRMNRRRATEQRSSAPADSSTDVGP